MGHNRIEMISIQLRRIVTRLSSSCTRENRKRKYSRLPIYLGHPRDWPAAQLSNIIKSVITANDYWTVQQRAFIKTYHNWLSTFTGLIKTNWLMFCDTQWNKWHKMLKYNEISFTDFEVHFSSPAVMRFECLTRAGT